MSISLYDDFESENSRESYNLSLGRDKNDVLESINITISPNTQNKYNNYEDNNIRKEKNNKVMGNKETPVNYHTTGNQSSTKGIKMINNAEKDNNNTTITAIIIQNRTTKIMNDYNYKGHEKRRYYKNYILSNITSTDVSHVSTLKIRRALDTFIVTPITNDKFHKGNHKKANKINKESPAKANKGNEDNYKKPNKTYKINHSKPNIRNRTKSNKTLSSRSIKYFEMVSSAPAKAITSPTSELRQQTKSNKKEEKPTKKQGNFERSELASKFSDLKKMGERLVGVDKDDVWFDAEQGNTDLNLSYFNYDQNYNSPRGRDYTARYLEKKEIAEVKNNKLVPEPEVITKGNKKINKTYKLNNSYNVYDVTKRNEIGANTNIFGYANKNFGSVALNPDLEPSQVSYSYPKEYNIFEVLVSPGIPEAINFRTSNASSSKLEPSFMGQTTVHDIFIDVDPEMYNWNKKIVRNNVPKISKAKKLVPDPNFVTHSTKLFKPRVFEDYNFSLLTTQLSWQPQTKKEKLKIFKNPQVKRFSKILEEEFKVLPAQMLRTPKGESLRKESTKISIMTRTSSTSTTQARHTPLTESTSPSSSSRVSANVQLEENLDIVHIQPTENSANLQLTEKYFIHDYDAYYDYHQQNLSKIMPLPKKQEAIPMQELKTELVIVSAASKIVSPVEWVTAAVTNATRTNQSEGPREHWWTPSHISRTDPFNNRSLNTLPKKLSTTTKHPIRYTAKTYKTTTQVRYTVKVLQTHTQTPPPPSKSSFTEQLKIERKKMEVGHFTYIMYKFMEFIIQKRPLALAKQLLDQLLPATMDWYHLRPTMNKLGEPFTKGIHILFTNLQQDSPETLQEKASSFYKALKLRHETLSPEFNYIFSTMDKIYTQDEIKKIYVALEEVKNYPNTIKNANQVISHWLEETFVEPFHRLGPTERRHKLVESLNIYVSYKYFNGKQIFIPENALRRKIEEDASVGTKSRKQMLNLNLGKMKIDLANGKMLIESIKNQLANSTKDSDEEDFQKDEEGTNLAQAEEEKLKAKLNMKISAENSMLIDKNVSRLRSITNDNILKDKMYQVTKNIKHKKTNKQAMKQIKEKVDPLSDENFKYIIKKRLPKTKVREKSSPIWNNEKSNYLKNNIAAKQHKSPIKTSYPKFDEYVALNTEEFLKRVKKSRDSLTANNKYKKVIPVSKNIKRYTTSNNRHQKQQMNKSKKRVVEKYHSKYEIYTKKHSKKKIKKHRNEKHVIKDNNNIRLSNKNKKATQKSLKTTTRKRFKLFKKHIKLKIRDHTEKQTPRKESKLLINKISVKKVNKYFRKPDFHIVTSEILRQPNRGDSDSYWHPPENYSDADNDTSSSDWEAQNNIFVDNNGKLIKKRLNNRDSKAFIKNNKTMHVTTKRRWNTIKVKTTPAKPTTPSKIIKKLQVEISKTKVPYTVQEMIRDKRKRQNRQIDTEQKVNNNKYLEAHKSGELPDSYVRNTESPKSNIFNEKTRINTNTYPKRIEELFDAYDNTDSSDSLEDSSRKDVKLIRKMNYESSYSDQEIHLKVNLKDALIHGLDLGLNRRMLNADIDEEHAKLNLRMLSPSSGSDEEHLIKFNIYKSFGGTARETQLGHDE